VVILLTSTIDFPQTKPVQWVAAAIASISIIWFTWRSFTTAKPSLSEHSNRSAP